MASAKFEPLADQYLNVKVRGSDEFMTECPLCNGGSSLQFNINTGLWICFRCDEKGNAKKLVKKLGGTYTDPVASVEHIREHIDRLRARNKEKKKTEVIIDESYLSRFDFEDDYWTESRHLSPATVKHWQLGYDPIKDRHTIPYRNPDGELLGVIERRQGDVFPRYLYPKTFDRKNSLFGSWMLRGATKIGMVEGSTDVLSLYESGIPSLAQYGSAISKGQVRLLHRLGIREVIFFYDYDEAGLKAVERSREMIDGIILRCVQYDDRKYCWHKKLCGCGDHNWRTIGKCKKKKLCRCGKKHEMDPGSLTNKEKRRMLNDAELIGTVKSKWK